MLKATNKKNIFLYLFFAFYFFKIFLNNNDKINIHPKPNIGKYISGKDINFVKVGIVSI